ncbi:MAG: hypothetical protein IJ629_00300 [Clostridia bacterium]|nr:hypothetical protein [Clostridia bacterium]
MNLMKKIGIMAVILLIFASHFYIAYAETEVPQAEAIPTEQQQEASSETAETLKEAKQNVSDKLKKYVDDYGSYPYGVAAYVLNTVRIYSIPFCFVGIVVGSIYQYMLGIRKLDVRDKGFSLIVTFVTILLICQVLPLIFAIVVNGWRG